jgi:hypothetical protein
MLDPTRLVFIDETSTNRYGAASRPLPAAFGRSTMFRTNIGRLPLPAVLRRRAMVAP